MSAKTAGPAGTPSVDPVNDFFVLLKTLLTTVGDVFPECVKTREALANREFIHASHQTSMKETLIRDWYTTTKPYIKQFVEKQDNVILRTNIDVLERLDIRTKWADPEFDHEDKEVLWGYINSLTYLACLYNESTPEQVQGLAAVAQRVAEKAEFDIDPSGRMSFNVKAFENMITNEASQGDLGELVQGVAPLMGAMMGGGEGGANGLQAFLQSQMSNFSSLLQPPGDSTPK